MKFINVHIKLSFNDMGNFEKDFHVSLINEIMKKGTKHLKSLNVNVEEVRRNDVSYDMS
jgi:hypothetical protein